MKTTTRPDVDFSSYGLSSASARLFTRPVASPAELQIRAGVRVSKKVSAHKRAAKGNRS